MSSKQTSSQQRLLNGWRRSYLEKRVRVGGAGGEGTLLAVGVQGGRCWGGELREVLSQRSVKDALQGRHLQVRRRGRKTETEGACQEVEEEGAGGRTLTVEERRPNVSCEGENVLVRGASCDHTLQEDKKWRQSTGTTVASPQTSPAGQLALVQPHDSSRKTYLTYECRHESMMFS